MIGNKFRVRVLKESKIIGRYIEINHYNLSYDKAVEWFKFYVDAILEFNLDARCVNIFIGKRCIKLFQNH